jgi:hypothetical protein
MAGAWGHKPCVEGESNERGDKARGRGQSI